jgi:hypothetical protein
MPGRLPERPSVNGRFARRRLEERPVTYKELAEGLEKYLGTLEPSWWQQTIWHGRRIIELLKKEDDYEGEIVCHQDNDDPGVF